MPPGTEVVLKVGSALRMPVDGFDLIVLMGLLAFSAGAAPTSSSVSPMIH